MHWWRGQDCLRRDYCLVRRQMANWKGPHWRRKSPVRWAKPHRWPCDCVNHATGGKFDCRWCRRFARFDCQVEWLSDCAAAKRRVCWLTTPLRWSTVGSACSSTETKWTYIRRALNGKSLGVGNLHPRLLRCDHRRPIRFYRYRGKQLKWQSDCALGRRWLSEWHHESPTDGRWCRAKR